MTHQVVKKARKSLPSDSSARLKDLLDAFASKVPGEDLDLIDPEHFAQTIAAHWEMARDRKKGQPLIRIHTEDPDIEGMGTGHTIIDIVQDDMPFLVDSIAAQVGNYNKLIELLLHPILFGQFSPDGKLKAIHSEPGTDTLAQSHMHIHLQGVMPKGVIKKLEKDLLQVLRDVRYATQDWQKMKERLRYCQKGLSNAPKSFPDEEIEEYLYFLEYLYKDNFTLLGYREYKFTGKQGNIRSKTVKGSSLGLLHDDIKPVYLNDDDKGLPEDLQTLRRNLPPLTISKVNRRSTVHRPVPLDAVAVKRFDEKGNIVGECVFVGLFTSVTYSRSIQDIPLLRLKTAIVLNRSGFKPGGHNYKTLAHILEKYPRDELFQINIDDLQRTALGILRLQERRRIALYIRKDPFRRYMSCLVYVPRDRYDTRLRVTMQKILEEELEGVCDDFQTNLDDSSLARVLYTITTNQKKPPRFDTATIEQRLEEAGQVWSEKLAEALLQAGKDEHLIPDIVYKYGDAFSSSYIDAYTGRQAVYDIDKIEETIRTGQLALDLYQCNACEGDQLRLKIYSQGKPITLSAILPILENMGVRVISEFPFEVRPQGGDAVWIHDFMMEGKQTYSAQEIDERKPKFEDALLRVWYDEMADDSLNHLILGAGMNWRDVMLLRSFVHYLRQARYPFSTRFIERTLFTHSGISHYIIELFKAYHNPETQDSTASNVAGCMVAIDHALEKVDSLEQDRTLRSIVGLVNASLRTNFFQPGPDGAFKSYLSIKYDSRAIPELPNPKPYREIHVYSPRVEGIHLRGDIIARGGLRWSDRFEDFRTEVLGLMKAQQVKNSLIVPMGAKGGFVVKKPPAGGDRKAYLAEGIECYKTFIRGLLDITDNRKGRKVVPPKNVVRRDGDDPYLVVAADKGTASFSDIANGISAEYDFWLGDAFASGGSAGYDHKEMGITARGAWESVKRHFRELNHDIQSKDFDVIGVGDMSGDVFGNGMLLSPHIRLVGAFNHIHIFCDPSPDPKASLKERERLFKETKGWDAYNEKKLSEGGRIYLRSEKSLQLTPEIRERFDIDRERVTPAELIQAMLRARTDLLWFGGIGTYIKATTESHADVGDKANDALRINAHEIRAKVIGEGANLAVTQEGRIEYYRKGGKINADFIDNSGGVNSSDVEVNIKILFGQVLSEKNSKLTLAKRNKMLEDMTEEVAALVLHNNYQQAQGISLMEMKAHRNLPEHAEFIETLEEKYAINREVENLPTEEELEEMGRAGKGLSRPEICTLQAYAKIFLTKAILTTDIPDTDDIEEYWLYSYFPTPLRKKYAKEIKRHRLHREIIATALACDIVNRMGPTFVQQLQSKSGANISEVVSAYMIVRQAFELPRLWADIESLDNKVAAKVQLSAMLEISEMAERETLWFLTRLGRRPRISEDIENFRAGIHTLQENLESVITTPLATNLHQKTQALTNDGLPDELARHIAMIRPLGSAGDIILISMMHKTEIPIAAHLYYELGEKFHLHWLRRQARYMRADDRWSTEALEGMVEQFYNCQAGLTVRILKDMKKPLSEDSVNRASVIDTWVNTHVHQAHHIEEFFEDMRKTGTVDLPVLTVAEHRLRQLYRG